MKSRVMGMDVLLGIFGGLVALAMVSIYSALKLAKRTDDLVLRMDSLDKSDEPINVWYPASVFERPPKISRISQPRT